MALLETALLELLKKIFEWLGNPFKRKIKVSELMTDSIDVQEISRDVIFTEGLTVDFCYLMLAYNGKKVDKIHRYKFRKIISGDHNWSVKNFRIRDYRRLPVDAQYSYLLEKVKLEGAVSMDVSSMNDGSLKAIYLNQHLVYIRYYYIEDTNEGLWYLVAGTHAGGQKDFDSVPHVQKIFFSLAQLKKIINNS